MATLLESSTQQLQCTPGKIHARQKHPGCRKVRGQSEAALQIGMYD